jgi:cyanophycinase
MKNKVTILFLVYAFLLSATLKGQGNLVIVGGALDRSNHEVYHKFIELAGGQTQAVISIVPSASGSPALSGKSFKQNLMEYGVPEENIFIIPVAVLDCSSTPETDESLWKDGAEDPDVVATISRSSGIWFSGGDQSRITATFMRADGSETPALQSIREVWQNGAVIGGTSAGAAMMSHVMITGGVSMASLKHGASDQYISSEQQDNGPLTISTGLGFFTHGIIDQHFDKKTVLGG